MFWLIFDCYCCFLTLLLQLMLLQLVLCCCSNCYCCIYFYCICCNSCCCFKSCCCCFNSCFCNSCCCVADVTFKYPTSSLISLIVYEMTTIPMPAKSPDATSNTLQRKKSRNLSTFFQIITLCPYKSDNNNQMIILFYT